MSGESYRNIFITKDAPLVIQKDTDLTHYGKVFMDNGAYIEVRAGDSLTIEQLLSLSAMTKEDRLTLASYPTLMETDAQSAEPIRDWAGYDVIVTAKSGGNGQRGEGGGVGGGCGQFGGSGAPGAKETRGSFTFTVNDLLKNVNLLSTGGNGGNGGVGGHGGEGWDGVDDIPGTIGGNGGNGGKGGDGGDAVPCVFVRWASEIGCGVNVICQPSPGGKGGKGGLAGLSGRNYRGVNPSDGKEGKDGAQGKAGTWKRIYALKSNQTPLAGLFTGNMEASMDNAAPGKLDFSNRAQAETFLAHFGGEDYLSQNYPKFYAAYQRTVSEAGVQAAKLPDGTIPKTFAVTAINSKKRLSSKVSEGVEAATMLEVGNSTIIHDATPSYCLVTGEIKNLTERVTMHSYALLSESKELDYYFWTNPLDYVGANGKKFNETSYRTFITNDALLGAETASSDAVLISGYKELISSITISEPKSASGNNPLNYLYGRGPVSGETADKSYNSADVDYQDKDNSVKTLLGIKGSITFANSVSSLVGFAKSTDTENRRVLIGGKGAASYNYNSDEIAKFFTIDKSNPRKVNFAFPDDWKCRLDKDLYDSGAKAVVMYLLFSFYYTVKIGDTELAIPITIKSQSSLGTGESYYEAKESSTVLIPPVKIRWGCFSADTLVKMGDDNWVKICGIRPGDEVATPSGIRRVTEVYTGREKSLMFIKAESGECTRVTKDHPVITESGAVRAARLRTGDSLKLADSTCSKVAEVYEIEYETDQPVFNIEVEGGLVYADGFLSGEITVQNDMTEAVTETRESESFSQEALDVIEEFKRLCAERFSLSN